MTLDFKAILAKIIPLVAFVAPLTPTTIDDEALKLLRALDASPALLDWFKGKFAQDQAGVLSIETDPPEPLVEELRLRDLDWGKLIEKLPALIALFRAHAG